MSFVSRLGNSITGNRPGPANPFGVPDFNYQDALKATDPAFNDWIGYLKTTGAPTSVDAVRGGVNSDLMSSILSGIDTDTAHAAGSLKLDAQDAGLGGPGQASEPEFSSLATTYADAAKNKGEVRSQFALSELEKMSQKEAAQRAAESGAYGMKYGSGLDLYSSLLSGDASAWNSAEARRISGMKPNYLSRIGNEFSDSFANHLGAGYGDFLTGRH